MFHIYKVKHTVGFYVTRNIGSVRLRILVHSDNGKWAEQRCSVEMNGNLGLSIHLNFSI